MGENWQHLVDTAPTRTYQRKATVKGRLLVRYVPYKAFAGHDPASYLYASGNLNRCNPAGIPCIYFGEGSTTARAEFDSYHKSPLTELGYYARASLRAIIDLADESTCKHLGVTRSDFTCPYVTKSGELIRLQQIGRAVAAQNRVSAIRFPSNAMLNQGQAGFNLVVFQDLVTAPDFLEILEDNQILERWPRQHRS